MSSPTDVATLANWWKADSLALNDGDAVASWSDSSGAGATLTQGTAGYRPIFKTNILNGQPVVRYQGTDDAMDATIVSVAQPATWFVVVKAGDSLRQSQVFNSGHEVDRKADNHVEGYAGTGAASGHMHDGSVFEIWALVFNGATSLFFYNGTQDGFSSTVGTAATGTAFHLGYHPSLPARAFLGDIAEVILYSSGLSSGDRATVDSYFSDKYGLTVADYVPSVTARGGTGRQLYVPPSGEGPTCAYSR